VCFDFLEDRVRVLARHEARGQLHGGLGGDDGLDADPREAAIESHHLQRGAEPPGAQQQPGGQGGGSRIVAGD
jgi:hypothetical protein